MKILIVEDDFGSRRLLQVILREQGLVDSVVDGEEAIQAFILAWQDNEPYELIFMDIMMPKKDGQVTLKEMRKLEKEMGVLSKDEVPIIMLTALDDPKNVVEAFNTGGATGYIVKPIDKETLVQELKKFDIYLHP